MTLSVVSLIEIANRQHQPFHVYPLAHLGPLSVSVYICQGEMEWHKHLDEDELFLVHEGVITLDTDRGELSLHAEELAVVPQGVWHRSRSMLRSVVVLVRPAVMSERTNGHRHFYTTDAEPPLEKVRLAPTLAAAPEPFRPLTLGRVDGFVALGAAGRGLGPEVIAPAPGVLWLVVRGGLRVEAGDEVAQLNAGELTVVPAGQRYRLICPEPALLLSVAAA